MRFCNAVPCHVILGKRFRNRVLGYSPTKWTQALIRYFRPVSLAVRQTVISDSYSLTPGREERKSDLCPPPGVCLGCVSEIRVGWERQGQSRGLTERKIKPVFSILLLVKLLWVKFSICKCRQRGQLLTVFPDLHLVNLEILEIADRRRPGRGRMIFIKVLLVTSRGRANPPYSLVATPAFHKVSGNL